MSKLLDKHTFLILALCITIGTFFHLYNLNWGAPYYFHPDERNIATSVSQLHFPDQSNPNFFAYGSLPIYVIYSTGVLFNIITHAADPLHVDLPMAIIVSRVYSALLATLLIPLIYVLGKTIKGKQTGLLAAFFATMSVGFIQFSHFGTFEMWLTFFGTLLFYGCLYLSTRRTWQPLIITAGVFGILVAIKVSSLALLPLPLLAIMYSLLQKKSFHHLLEHLPALLTRGVVFFLIASLTYLFTNPYAVLDFHAFQGSMQYESSVALGSLPVFYTGEFFGTIPVLYQLFKVYPFLLNPLLVLLLLPSLLYVLYQAKKHKHSALLFLLAFYFVLFLSQAFLFVKWVRYMMPTLPFVYLIIALSLGDIFTFMLHKHASKKYRLATPAYAALSCLILISCLFAVSYFVTAFARADTRVTANMWARKNIAANTSILSEPYDLGIMPFSTRFPAITTYSFYDLDNQPEGESLYSLSEQLKKTSAIILPSQRIMKTRLTNQQKFPQGHAFYHSLFKGELGFQQVYQTPCDIFCRITYLGDPLWRYEETANVFDRPTIFIFSKKS